VRLSAAASASGQSHPDGDAQDVQGLVEPDRYAAGFRRLATTYTLNELGWGFGTVALSLLVFEHTHSALATTALWLCTLLVPAFVGPAATAQLDRLGVRRVICVGISA
jgi:hypothetical protein